ncbi:MAG: glycoside hydrolase family 2 TIM barrel-domain containing protein [Candidatus Omnitrophota bacterium]
MFKKIGIIIILIAVTFAAIAATNKKERIYVKKLKNGHWQLIVNKKAYFVRGVCYAPVPIGKSYLFDMWANPYKPWRIDGQLMKEMGVNTIRIYNPGDDYFALQEVITELYLQNGIRTILGHSLGFWDYPAANYADAEVRKKITGNVLTMVKAFKDVPGILFWNLGNENNYSFDGRINSWSSAEIDKLDTPQKRSDMRAKIYYKFIDDLAKKIKRIDPDHPVALGNGESHYLEIAHQQCRAVDILGCIVYRGKSFGSFFKEVKRKCDRPVVLTEFGADAYNAQINKEDQRNQAVFLKLQWQEISNNRADFIEGEGNCLGGTIFEWTDEWWKHSESDRDSWHVHDRTARWGNGAYYYDARVKNGLNMNEEWFGIVGLSANEMDAGIDKRIPRKAYYMLKDIWTKEREEEDDDQ